MDEDENPFGVASPLETPSAFQAALSEATNQLSLSSPPRRIPSSGTRKGQIDPKTEFCCSTDRALHSGNDVEILVSRFQLSSKFTDWLSTRSQMHRRRRSMQTHPTSYTSLELVYVPFCKAESVVADFGNQNAEAKHRYSEFESFRQCMIKLYPTLIIPPIPSKNTIGDYATKQAKAKEDAALISRRKRMLQTFLNRIARHPILSNEHVFHRFLDGEVSWVRSMTFFSLSIHSLIQMDVLKSPPITLLPKNILKAPSHNPTDQTASPAYSVLSNPSAAHPLRNPDQRFLDSEAFTHKFANHLSGPMEKITRRVIKRWIGTKKAHRYITNMLIAYYRLCTGSR